MAEEQKHENEQQHGDNIGKTFYDVEFTKVGDKFTVIVDYDANSELLSLKLINQTTKNVFKQHFNKESVHKITDECKLKPHLVVKMIIDTLKSKQLTAKNIRIFLLANIKQAIAKRDEIRSVQGIPDAVDIPTKYQPKSNDNDNNNNELENCLLFVLHFSAPPYIYFNYTFIVKKKDVSDADKLVMTVNDLQKQNQWLKREVITLKNTVNAQQQQLQQLTQSNNNKLNTINQRLQQLRTNDNTQSNTVQTQQQQINELTHSLNEANNSITTLTQRLQQLETKIDEEKKAIEEEVKFDTFDSRYVGVTQLGKVINTINNSCTYSCIFSSNGFNSGIKRWKIKIIKRAHGSTEQVGVSKNILQGSQSWDKQIEGDCDGISSGAGFKDGDVVSVELNFNTRKVTFWKNNDALKAADIENGTTYYPVIQICACSNQTLHIVD